MKGNRSWSCLAILLSALAAETALAWEFAYGPANTSDRANRRVTPVTNNCLGGAGFISVGTLDQGGPNPEVYVVRTNAAGGAVWEITYDVQGLALVDEGIALAQVPNAGGFVILSNTIVAGVWSPALTQIDCNGLVLWSFIYPDINGLNLRAYDLIRTLTGDPNFATTPGDLAVAGYSFNGAGANNDAFLMRTTGAGGLIWNIAYNTGVQEIFTALTEAVPLAGQLAGDLVAVGRYANVNNIQGLAARVNGNNGAIGAAPQCMAHHGGGSADTYFSVTQLATAPFAGQFAMVGTTTQNFGWLDDVWVVRGNPCGIAAQSRIGNAGVPATAEGGLDIREVLAALPAVPNIAVGDLAITGYHGPALVGPFDATLLFVQVGPLMPILANLFGDHGQRNEIGFSLDQNPAGGAAGFIVAGLTETNWEGLGDPRDLYLVNAVNGGGVATACSIPWAPVRFQIQWPSVNLAPLPRAPAQSIQVQTPFLPLISQFQVCP